MALPTDVVWQFPYVPCPGGKIEIRINPPGSGPTMYAANLGYYLLVLQGKRNPTITSIGEIVQALQDSDGDLNLDNIELGIYDSFTWSGYQTDAVGNITPPSSGTPMSGDLTGDSTTFLNELFSDETAPYTVFMTRIDGVTGAREVFFVGSFTAPEIPKNHLGVADEHTSSEMLQQTVTLSVGAMLGHLKATTVQQAVDLINVFDDDTSGNDPFYNGLQVTNIGEIGTDDAGEPIHGVLPNYDDSTDRTNGTGVLAYRGEDVDINPRGHSEEWPYGTSGIRITTVINLIAKACGFLPYRAGDLSSAFVWTEGWWNGTAYEDHEVGVEDHHICAHYAFGASPADGPAVTFDSPIAWKRDADVLTVLRDLAWGYGSYVTYDIHQGTEPDPITGLPTQDLAGMIRILLTNRLAIAGDLPSSWKLIDHSSSAAAKESAKEFISVSCRGDDTKYIYPPGKSGDAGVEIILPFRVRPFGETTAPVFPLADLVLSNSQEPLSQGLFFARRFSDAEDNALNPSAWALGAYLYSRYTTAATNRYYPPEIGPELTDDWTGFYALRSCTEKPGTYVKRGNVLYAAIQLYAPELLGLRTNVTRTYRGVLGDGGTIREVRPGMRGTWRYDGKLRTFRAIEIRQNVIANTTTVKWREVLDGDDAELTPQIVSGNASTSSSAGNSGGSTSANVGTGSTPTARGSGTTNLHARWIDAATLGQSRVTEPGTNGAVEVPGRLTDTLPALYVGTSTTGYTGTALAAVSDAGSAMTASSRTGSALIAVVTGNATAADLHRNVASASSAVVKVRQQHASGGTVALAITQTDTSQAGIDGGGARIANIATPTATTDAATKAYVDAHGLTSIGMTVPSEFSVTPATLTSNGTFAVTKATQTANTVWAGPTTGSAAAPTFRALVAADLPVFGASGTGHAVGAVPDPGGSAGTTRYLREDATWATISTGVSLTGTTSHYAYQSGTNTLATGRLANSTANGIVEALWINGDLVPTLYVGSNSALNGTTAILAESSTGYAIRGQSDGSVAATIYAQNVNALGVNAPCVESTGLIKTATLQVTSNAAASRVLTTSSTGLVTPATWAGFITATVSGTTITAALNAPYALTAGNAGILLQLTNSDAATGRAIYGELTGTSNGYGVKGLAQGSGQGVYGEIAGSGTGVGVYAYTGVTTGHAFKAEIGNAANTNDVATVTGNGSGNCLVVDQTGGGTSTTTSRNLFIGKAGGVRVARIDNVGKGFFNGGTQVGGADVAEAVLFAGDKTDYKTGDVLVFDTTTDSQYCRCTSANSVYVAGVVVADDAANVLMGVPTDGSEMTNRIAMARNGRVLVNVNGSNGDIHRGDILVTSATTGEAMKAGATPAPWTILGRAEEEFTGPASGSIMVLINPL